MAFELVNALRAPTITFTALLRRRLRIIRHINLVTMAKRLFVVGIACEHKGYGVRQFCLALLEKRLYPEQK